MKSDFKRKVLSNGMTILFEKRDLPIVSVAFAVKAGSINELENEKGIFHFIEHMLFKGTPTRTNFEITSEIEKRGGELNGFTSEEVVAYWCKMPSRHLNIALDVLSDVVKNPIFDEKELDKEKKVVFEEIKMNKDNPLRHVLKEIHSCLYEEPFSVGTLGTKEIVSSIDKEKITTKFKENYQPNNLILCVVGDANFDEVVNFVEKNFSQEKEKVFKIDVKLKNESKIEKRSGIDQANLVLGYHVPLAEDKKNYAARVLSALMTEGMSSRLFVEIREKRNLAYVIKGEAGIGKNFAYNLIYVGTSKENVEDVKKLILDEFDKISKELSEEELNQIKVQLIGNYHISMEDSQTQMINLLISEVEENAEEFYEFEKNISEVKLEDVKELAKIAIEKYSFFALVPDEE